MTSAIAILIGLVGYTVAMKMVSLAKIFGIKIENMNQQELEELLQDPRFRKYLR